VLPRPVKVIAGIVAAAIVSNPFVVVGVDMRSVRMSRMVGKVAALRPGLRCATKGLWSMRRNVSAAKSPGALVRASAPVL
jgi:hypothetical protein